MMRNATCQRILQFRAGPNSTSFAACDRHRPLLEAGDVGNFFGHPDDKIEELNPQRRRKVSPSTSRFNRRHYVIEDTGVECYFCRGEDGP